MRKIICALHCSMYENGSSIIEKGKPVDDVHFIFSGYAELLGTYKIKDNEFDGE
jgi:signal-transduction protein with cAMP-binding, CBS, and nucleotidyltransferase domain